MSTKKPNTVEPFFRDFVQSFGGEVLREAQHGSTADYLFRKQDIVAELKTLTVDQTKEMNRKLTPKVVEWIRKNGVIPRGQTQGREHLVEFKDMPPEIQTFWLKLLKASVEGLIRAANKQIRDTKTRMSMNTAKGLLIVANQANIYHDDADSLRRLVAEVLKKRMDDGTLRFPHVNGAIFFSLRDVKSRDEGMYFWANLQMKQTPDEDVTSVAAFQKELQQAWYSYIEKATGAKVRQHTQSMPPGTI